MIIGLVAVIVAFFAIFAGPKDDPLIADIDQFAKKVVIDKDIYAQIKGESKHIARLGKAYGKQTKKFAKQFADITVDQASTRQDFESLLTTMMTYEDEVNSDYYSRRLNILSLVSDDEWAGILEKAEKKITKDKKSKQKLLEMYSKGLANSQMKIVAAIDESDRKQKAEEYLDEFVLHTGQVTEDIFLVYHDNADLLRSRGATMEQMMDMSDTFASDWGELYDAYIDLHQNLAELCKASEWKKVGKELAKI